MIRIISKAEDLSNEETMLIDKAKKALLGSYSPYSNFKVGAAVIMANGEIYQGSNQENIAYGECICAERVTLLYATANNPQIAPKAIAIAAYTENDFLINPVTPCGSCRQVICEMEQRYNSDIKIIMYGKNLCYIADSAKELLPLSFDSLK